MSTHSLLHFSNYHCARKTLSEKVNKIYSTTLKQNSHVITKHLVFGNEKLKAAQNKSILSLQFSFNRLTRDLKPHRLIKFLMERYL